MSTGRTTPPRKRPAPSGVVALPVGAVPGTKPERSGDVDAGSAGGFDPNEIVGDFLRNFEAMLQNDPSIDGSQRGELLDFVSSSLKEAGEFPQDDLIDKSVWREAIDGLQRTGGVSDTEASDLTRRLDDALAPLERRKTKVALEFGRRLQQDGQEQALAWLRQQETNAAGTGQADASGVQPTPRNPGMPLAADAVNSRSRRVRGPPRQDG